MFSKLLILTFKKIFMLKTKFAKILVTCVMYSLAGIISQRIWR